MLLKRGRFGTFLGCSGYPECKNIVKAGPSGQPIAATEPPEISDVLCDKCGRPTAVKRGRYGKFLGCTGYPECKNIMKYRAPEAK
jgi:DNA topoisomerase-1